MRSGSAVRWIALLLISSSAGVSAQRVGESAIPPTPLASPMTLQPRWETRRLNGLELLTAGTLSTGMAVTVGVSGGATGMLLGFRSCAEREEYGTFSPFLCLFTTKGLVYGTYAGTFFGAALGAGSGAIRAGCPSNEGFTRSFLGSLAGSLPALGYLAAGGSGSEDVQNALLIGTPVLQIAGATTAVSRCRVLERGHRRR